MGEQDMKLHYVAARSASSAVVRSLPVSCGATSDTTLEEEYTGITTVEVESVSAFSLTEEQIVATFEVADVLLDRPADRITATWDAYAENGRTRLEISADGGEWKPFTVEF